MAYKVNVAENLKGSKGQNRLTETFL